MKRLIEFSILTTLLIFGIIGCTPSNYVLISNYSDTTYGLKVQQTDIGKYSITYSAWRQPDVEQSALIVLSKASKLCGGYNYNIELRSNANVEFVSVSAGKFSSPVNQFQDSSYSEATVVCVNK